MRIVEFLADVFKIFCKDVHKVFADTDLFNTLLFYFSHYPYHNILHAKVSEIIMTGLERNIENLISHFLYQTNLIKKILDTSNDGGVYTFQSTGLTLNRGCIAFTRKIANKLNDLQKSNEEVANFLESIPEWQEYYTNDLSKANLIEKQPLASDPWQKDTCTTDDYFDLIYKWKDVGKRSGF